MLPWLATVLENVLACATRVFEGIGKNRHSVKSSLIVNGLGRVVTVAVRQARSRVNGRKGKGPNTQRRRPACASRSLSCAAFITPFHCSSRIGLAWSATFRAKQRRLAWQTQGQLHAQGVCTAQGRIISQINICPFPPQSVSGDNCWHSARDMTWC